MLPWKWKQTLNMPTLPFLLVIMVVCNFLLLLILFFCKAVLAPAPLQFLHLPCFSCSPSILFAFLLTLSTFVSTTASLIIFATSSLSSLPFKSLFTSKAAGKNVAIEPVFCSVGRLSLVSREISTPRAPQVEWPPWFPWLCYPNWTGLDLMSSWVQFSLGRILTSWFLFFGTPPPTIYIYIYIYILFFNFFSSEITIPTVHT